MSEYSMTDMREGGAPCRSVEEVLLREGSYAAVTDGVSMRPLFKTHRDMVVMTPPDTPLKKYDVVLYRVGDKYILHRIIAVKGDTLVIRGDNTYSKEYVPKEAVLARLVSFNRKGKHGSVDSFGFKLYSRVWNFIYPLRAAVRKVRFLLSRLKRAVIGKNK